MQGPAVAVEGGDGGVELCLIAHGGFAAAGSRGRLRHAAQNQYRRQGRYDQEHPQHVHFC